MYLHTVHTVLGPPLLLQGPRKEGSTHPRKILENYPKLISEKGYNTKMTQMILKLFPSKTQPFILGRDPGQRCYSHEAGFTKLRAV